MQKPALLLIALSVLGVCLVQAVTASDDSNIAHYEAKNFLTAKEAFTGLVLTSREMASIASKANLNGQEIEKIHQISYTTENALKKLSQSSRYNFQPLEQALEDVHLASEKHNAIDLKSKFIIYQAELNSYLAHK